MSCGSAACIVLVPQCDLCSAADRDTHHHSNALALPADEWQSAPPPLQANHCPCTALSHRLLARLLLLLPVAGEPQGVWTRQFPALSARDCAAGSGGQRPVCADAHRRGQEPVLSGVSARWLQKRSTQFFCGRRGGKGDKAWPVSIAMRTHVAAVSWHSACSEAAIQSAAAACGASAAACGASVAAAAAAGCAAPWRDGGGVPPAISHARPGELKWTGSAAAAAAVAGSTAAPSFTTHQLHGNSSSTTTTTAACRPRHCCQHCCCRQTAAADPPTHLPQVRALCQNPNGGIPASFLSSQQSEAEAVAVKKELSKVCQVL